MKILYFGGGLGNQIFEYFFYKYLSEKYPNEIIYGVYPQFKFSEHVSGLEVDRVFDLKLPPTSWLVKIIIVILFVYKKISPNNRFVSLNPCEPKLNAFVFNAFKTDKSYYENNAKLIRFRKFELGSENESIVNKMHSSNSVSIHIRRGDFLSPQYFEKLGDIATKYYYDNAIEYIINKINDPIFFVFSDDIDWVKLNLEIENAIYITWNTDKNSYKDMYLMTQCKANIIANSTFSYWGAYLNENNPIVCFPKEWIRYEDYPNIFKDSWIGLPSK
ncbi:alpha-1,2-fucosyltransferase [Aquirufa sp. 5-AUSEE-100C1]